MRSRPKMLSQSTIERMSSKERANQMRGRGGGVPLQTLSPIARRQLTSSGSNRTRLSSNGPGFQGAKELAKAKARMDRAAARASNPHA